MDDHRARKNTTPTRLVCVDGFPVWISADETAYVRYEPTGTPATTLLSAGGEFDASSTDCLHEALTATHTPQTERTLLDLAHVTFADTAFVQELLTAHRRPGRLILIGPLTHPVRVALDLSPDTYSLFLISPEDSCG
ncbi:STAS domain-containing protein [Streptomyces sp. NPDC090056]|uniref:STAS domain-containing protein n=1 Tax=Streptomyces sp. NPDC090056 TaxID=3365934 RepID=UPI0037F64620